MLNDLAIVIPVRDERGTLGELLSELARTPIGAAEVVVVDDGSVDGSGDVARAMGVSVVRHAEGRGYGASLKTGLSVTSSRHVAIIDADGTYAPGDLPALLRALPPGGMVVGARSTEHSLPRRLGKRLFCLQVRLLTGHRVADLNSGLRIFDRRLAERLTPMLPERFSFTTTLTLGALATETPVKFVPVAYRQRAKGRSKFLPLDAWRFARTVTRGCGWIRGRSLAGALPAGRPSIARVPSTTL